jgi:hypothetical protein
MFILEENQDLVSKYLLQTNINIYCLHFPSNLIYELDSLSGASQYSHYCVKKIIGLMSLSSVNQSVAFLPFCMSRMITT